MIVQKAFKLLQPTHNQEVLINKTIGCARFAYNRFFGTEKELYSTEKKKRSTITDVASNLHFKKEIEWLGSRQVCSTKLPKNLDTAYKTLLT